MTFSPTRRACFMGLFALSACATSPDEFVRRSNLNMLVSDALPRPDRCVVLGSMGHTDMMNLAEPLISFEIRETPTDAGGRRTMNISDDLNLAGTWPGSFALKSLYLPANSQSYAFPGWNGGEARAVGRFEVGAGEVIYIGHLVFRAHGMRVDMQVEDRFDEFVKRLPSDVAQRVQKRLLSVPDSYTFNQMRRVQIR